MAGKELERFGPKGSDRQMICLFLDDKLCARNVFGEPPSFPMTPTIERNLSPRSSR